MVFSKPKLCIKRESPFEGGIVLITYHVRIINATDH